MNLHILTSPPLQGQWRGTGPTEYRMLYNEMLQKLQGRWMPVDKPWFCLIANTGEENPAPDRQTDRQTYIRQLEFPEQQHTQFAGARCPPLSSLLCSLSSLSLHTPHAHPIRPPAGQPGSSLPGAATGYRKRPPVKSLVTVQPIRVLIHHLERPSPGSSGQ